MSAGWDGESLLQPITADKPCGENVEQTLLPSFDALRLFGRDSSPDVPPPPPDDKYWTAPNWNEIRDNALEALKKSKDIRVLAHLGAALLRTDGLPAFSRTLEITSQWLNTYWGQTYPLIDDDGDAISRQSAVNCFADQHTVLDALRRAPLVSNRQLGRFSLRDVEIATGQAQPAGGDSRPEEAQITAAFAAMPLDELKALRQSVLSASAALKAIDAAMRSEAGTEAAPTFDPLSAQLVKVDRVLRAQLQARPDAEPVEESSPDSGGGARQAVGPIKSREDAIRTLDAVASFFRQTEPSSPLPLILERAKRLVSKSFLEVLADIAPGALGEARAAGGLKDGE